MREAFIRRAELTYVGRRQFQVVAVDTGEVLHVDSHRHDYQCTRPGNRINDRDARQCRKRLEKFCVENDVLLVDEPLDQVAREIGGGR